MDWRRVGAEGQGLAAGGGGGFVGGDCQSGDIPLLSDISHV